MNKISIIGSGNVAHHLGKAFRAAGFIINSVSSRIYENANELAKLLNCPYCDIKNIPESTDLVLLAVSDDAIEALINVIPKHINSVVHTSGSIQMDVFKLRFENYGVFYPLQSFNKDRDLDFSVIPILIEANNRKFEHELLDIAKEISNTFNVMDSASRKYLHLAAVFANNFVNLLALESYTILESHNIDGDLIRPLLVETVARLEKYHPKEVMTGPAKRNDLATLKNQEDLLKSDPKLQSLYRQISQLIMQRFNGSEL